MSSVAISRSRSSTSWSRRNLAPLGLIVLIFLQQLLFGAEQPRLALMAAVLTLSAAALVLLVYPRAKLPSALVILPFIGVCLTGVAQQIPLGAGGNPAWDYIGRPMIATLDPWATRVEMIKLLGLAAVFFLAMQIGRDDRWRPAFFKGLVLAGLAYGVWAFLDRILSPDTFLGLSRAGYTDRLTGSFLSANTAGTLFGVYVVVAVCAFAHALGRLRNAPKSERIARLSPPLALFVVSTACLLESASRGASLATVAAVLAVVALLIWDRSRRDRISGAASAVLLGLLAVAAVIYVAGGQEVTDRMGTLDEAVKVRAQLYAGYWRAFLDAPMLGYGLGAFHQINAQIAPPSDPLNFVNVGSAHNVYLQWLVEGGAVGSALMLLTLMAIIGRCVLGFARNRSARPYVLAACGSLLLATLHGATDFALQIPSICALLAALLGVAYGLSLRRA
jgi:O-antigen ligase